LKNSASIAVYPGKKKEILPLWWKKKKKRKELVSHKSEVIEQRDERRGGEI